VADRAGTSWRAAPAALWSPRTWLSVAHLVTGGLLWAVPAYVAVGLAGVATKATRKLDGGAHSKVVDLSVGLSVLLLFVLLLIGLTPRFTAWQRARFRAMLGVDLLPYPSAGTRPTDRSTWRQVRYHAVGGALVTVAAAVVVGCGVAGALLLVMPPLTLHKPGLALGLIVLGAALLLVLPWLARGAVALDVAAARALLQPSGTEALAARVRSLSASRAGVVDAADAERRRIERDLHDGTQQRLASLAMNLGLTRSAVKDMPREVRDAVAGAHEEAKLALAELRHFIRGLHPAVLDEVGLDAALSGIAARSPVPVRLSVDLPERAPVAVETVAYFVVSEALSNVARHAAATRAEVLVQGVPAGLHLSITDDGHGGADPARGTGLRGLRQRVESLDGTLCIDSPPGGPTTIEVTLPCAS
jgi:signal transduction histidine kinase